MHKLESADAFIVGLFSKRSRWFTTIGLQTALALLFIFFPVTTMEWFQVPVTPEMGILYQIYGTSLICRSMIEQYVRAAAEPAWMRRYMVASYPFNLGLAYFLALAAYRGLMTKWFAYTIAAMSLWEVLEFTYALVRWSRAVRDSETSAA